MNYESKNDHHNHRVTRPKYWLHHFLGAHREAVNLGSVECNILRCMLYACDCCVCSRLIEARWYKVQCKIYQSTRSRLHSTSQLFIMALPSAVGLPCLNGYTELVRVIFLLTCPAQGHLALMNAIIFNLYMHLIYQSGCGTSVCHIAHGGWRKDVCRQTR